MMLVKVPSPNIYRGGGEVCHTDNSFDLCLALYSLARPFIQTCFLYDRRFQEEATFV